MAHGQPLLNTVIGMPPFADHLTLDDFLDGAAAAPPRLRGDAALRAGGGRRLRGVPHPRPDRAPPRDGRAWARAWPRPGCSPPTSTWA